LEYKDVAVCDLPDINECPRERAGRRVHVSAGFEPVPRLQIVVIEEALALRDRAVKLPARRDDAFKRAAREEDGGR
jgi:hypothetical protein